MNSVDSPATNAPAYLTTDPSYWSANDVAQWAKDVLQWDDDEADVLVQQRLKGVRLLSYENNEDAFIRNLSSSIPVHSLHHLFSQIADLSFRDKMRQAKKRPESEVNKILILVITNETKGYFGVYLKQDWCVISVPWSKETF